MGKRGQKSVVRGQELRENAAGIPRSSAPGPCLRLPGLVRVSGRRILRTLRGAFLCVLETERDLAKIANLLPTSEVKRRAQREALFYRLRTCRPDLEWETFIKEVNVLFRKSPYSWIGIAESLYDLAVLGKPFPWEEAQ
jgi:hypothetical protein